MSLKAKLKQEADLRRREGALRKALTEGSAAFNKGDFDRVEALLREALTGGGPNPALKKSARPFGLSLNERIRYAKDIYGKKAVLFTRKVDDEIYFGIARCNRDAGDDFDRVTGINLARERAELVEEGEVNLFAIEFPFDGLSLSDDGLSGLVHEDDVHDLLDYFYELTAR